MLPDPMSVVAAEPSAAGPAGPAGPAGGAAAAATAAATGRRRRRGAPVWLLVVGAAACLYYFAQELRALGGGLGLPLDDSWIHLQFARNLAAGLGLSYNPGELVTGSTAPLWTALLALLAMLPGNPVAWAQLAGALLYLAGIDATWRLARELGLPRGLAALAGLLTLGTGWLVWSALSGMEVPLFVLLSLWGMIVHLRERAADTLPLAPALLALAALARPEGLLLLALALGDRCLVFGGGGGAASAGDAPGERARWRRPRLGQLAAGALLAGCVLAGPLLFYRLAGGSFLPTTFGAKGGQLRHWLPNLQYVYVVLGIFLRPQPYMTLAAGGGVARLVARLGSRRDRGLLPGLWLVALPLAYSTISPEGSKLLAGNFGRYYFPLIPVAVVVGLVGMEGAAATLRRLAAGGGRRAAAWAARLAAPALAALLVWPTAIDLWQRAGFYALNLVNVEQSDVRAARWLAPRLPAGAVLAVNDIGAFKYLLPNRVIDLGGIANPELRREVGALTAGGLPFERAMAAAVARRRPDYVAIFPAWLPHLAAELELRPLLRLDIADNVTMGSDQLVIYATPWTRFPLLQPRQPAPPP